MPERTCVGCRRKASKSELVRLVRTPSGEVVLDPSGKAPGRGAYVDPDPECLSVSLRRGRLARALRTRIGAEAVERLESAFVRELAEGAV